MHIELTHGDIADLNEWELQQDPSVRAPEELAELIVTFLHWRRGKASSADVIGECADVIICTAQIANEILGGNGVEGLNEMIQIKLEKAQAQLYPGPASSTEE